jgi:hypothetical protein
VKEPWTSARERERSGWCRLLFSCFEATKEQRRIKTEKETSEVGIEELSWQNTERSIILDIPPFYGTTDDIMINLEVQTSVTQKKTKLRSDCQARNSKRRIE